MQEFVQRWVVVLEMWVTGPETSLYREEQLHIHTTRIWFVQVNVFCRGAGASGDCSTAATASCSESCQVVAYVA